ncbi:binding-protein-dependent transport systems inner membrane component [Beutenbergia cavernae DSM 12333]|uniref:Binding-protein-dependent transport systems inner membrane component n=1 Tax=Beutenbergia cavernae (strain ATCC BAA-8 / DSM 12333 / CCUG 43141 / JCM 11478 / NBRC 16432 / NCIMB 13614 / HKI 0122) TaxID=471853 RepID=C5BY47_BEUC1|nr:sugar ABC transporter permease [Beutenbergia cavernae]ACQ80947.1 binding-protein-dependent transport systems inner membrane component [Beutenbergia cavernae DSM 12333]
MTQLTRRPRAGGHSYRWQARGFILPALVVVTVVLYLPFVWTTWISFTEYSGLGTPEPIGFANYPAMFADPNFLVSLRNTLLWVVGTIALPVGLGLLIAVLVHGLPGSFWFKLPFLLPYAISGIAVGVIWTFILQTGGALSEALAFLHLPGSELRWLLDAPLNTIVMILASTWQGAGVNALLFGIGLQSIPKEPIEAARVDGASGWRMFRSMTWPMLAPLTTVVVGLAIVGSLKTFDIVWGMTKGGPGRVSETLALTMYQETFLANDYGLGAAVAVFLTVVTVIASVLYLRRQLSEDKVV